MTDRDLTDLLEHLGDRVDVSPPPLAAMTRAADRTRRRRTSWAVGGAVAAAVALVAGGAQVIGDGLADDTGTRPPADRPVPAGMRLVGIGHAAIAVPEEWGTNDAHCGTPKADTVIVDVGMVEACLTPRPRNVESVWIHEGTYQPFEADERIEIDGVPAERQRTDCSDSSEGVVICTGAVRIPSEDVTFVVESSTTRAAVDKILARIRILAEQVGVPGHQEPRLGGDGYVARLTALGFEVEQRPEVVPARRAGDILAVTPAPGAVVEPGSKVTVTVTAPPRGPADEVRVTIGTYSKRDSIPEEKDAYLWLEDDQIRAGATLRVKVGDDVWAWADGKRWGTLAADLRDDLLEPQEGPGSRIIWTAAVPGTTTLRLTITADGNAIELGTVTVIVAE